MRKPDGYDDSAAFDGEFEQVELGGHVMSIRRAYEDATANGNHCLRLWLDIAEGPQRGYFTDKWNREESKGDNRRWGCIYTQLTEGNSIPYFKGLISSVNKSNPGYRFEDSWDEGTLVNKFIGGVFGREQFRDSKGELKWAVKCRFLRSVEAIKAGVEVPEDKYLDGGFSGGMGAYEPAPEDIIF